MEIMIDRSAVDTAMAYGYDDTAWYDFPTDRYAYPVNSLKVAIEAAKEA